LFSQWEYPAAEPTDKKKGNRGAKHDCPKCRIIAAARKIINAYGGES